MRDRQEGGPIRDLHAMVCPWIRGKIPPPSSSASPVLCVDVRASGSRPEVSPRSVLPTLVGPPSASGTGACCPPTCWEKVPSAASVPRPQRLQDGPRSAQDGRCETLHHLLRVPAEVTGVELFSPQLRPVVATQIMPMVKGKVR